MSRIAFADIERLPDFAIRPHARNAKLTSDVLLGTVVYDASVRDDNCHFDMQWSDDSHDDSFTNTMNLRTQAVTASGVVGDLPPRLLIARLVETVDLYVTLYVADLWRSPEPRRRNIRFKTYTKTGEDKGGWAAPYEIVAACPASSDWEVGTWEITLQRAVS